MKRLITARDVEDVRKSGGSIVVSQNVIITPSAKDLIREHKIRLIEENASGQDSFLNPLENPSSNTIYLAYSQGGLDYYQKLKNFWQRLDYEVITIGHVADEAAFNNQFNKYDKKGFLIFVAENGFRETVWFNKVTRFRAVRCSNIIEAKTARQEINADVLVLGAELAGWKQALKTAYAFVTGKE